MTHFSHFIEHIFWGSVGLAIALIILFAMLHVARTNAAITSLPVVGAPVAGLAGWVGTHATNY